MINPENHPSLVPATSYRQEFTPSGGLLNHLRATLVPEADKTKLIILSSRQAIVPNSHVNTHLVQSRVEDVRSMTRNFDTPLYPTGEFTITPISEGRRAKISFQLAQQAEMNRLADFMGKISNIPPVSEDEDVNPYFVVNKSILGDSRRIDDAREKFMDEAHDPKRIHFLRLTPFQLRTEALMLKTRQPSPVSHAEDPFRRAS